MGFLSWIIFGAIVGWIANMLAGKNNKSGCLTNIAIGLVGSAIGGWISTQLGFGTVYRVGIGSFAMAILGAVILLLILNMISKN